MWASPLRPHGANNDADVRKRVASIREPAGPPKQKAPHVAQVLPRCPVICALRARSMASSPGNIAAADTLNVSGWPYPPTRDRATWPERLPESGAERNGARDPTVEGLSPSSGGRHAPTLRGMRPRRWKMRHRPAATHLGESGPAFRRSGSALQPSRPECRIVHWLILSACSTGRSARGLARHRPSGCCAVWSIESRFRHIYTTRLRFMSCRITRRPCGLVIRVPGNPILQRYARHLRRTPPRLPCRGVSHSRLQQGGRRRARNPIGFNPNSGPLGAAPYSLD